jgi:chromosome segregation ATPase
MRVSNSTMKHRQLSRAIAVALLAGSVLSLSMIGSPYAQDDRDRAALRRLQQQLSKLQQDNAALQRDKADLEQKLKAAQQELDKAKGQAGKLGRTSKALAAAEKDNSELKAKLEGAQTALNQTTQKCQADLAGLRANLAETQGVLEKTKTDGAQAVAQLQTSLDAQTFRAQGCEAKNVQLFGVTEDLIKRYKENRGAWEKFLLAEPFTQIKSVQVESLLEEMREKAREARVEMPGGSGSAGKP